jgi:hypothetical protein
MPRFLRRPTWDESSPVLALVLGGLTLVLPSTDLGYALLSAGGLLGVVLWTPVRGLLAIPPHATTSMPNRLKQWSYELDRLGSKEPDAARALERYHDEPYRHGHPRSLLGLALLDEAQGVGLATDDDHDFIDGPPSVPRAAARFREIAGRHRTRRIRFHR